MSFLIPGSESDQLQILSVRTDVRKYIEKIIEFVQSLMTDKPGQAALAPVRKAGACIFFFIFPLYYVGNGGVNKVTKKLLAQPCPGGFFCHERSVLQ